MVYIIPNTTVEVHTVLSGHVSPDTAYVVNDYPFGFRLRCKIRYWLEFNARHGTRLVSQTTNPKRAGEVWNKPKASTYRRFGGAMFLDEKGHVQWTGLSEYASTAECLEWSEHFRDGVAEGTPRKVLDAWIKLKQKRDEATKQPNTIPVHPLTEEEAEGMMKRASQNNFGFPKR